MTRRRLELLRMVAAVAIVAAACPTVLFGGALTGCAGRGFNGDCAASTAFLAPVLLVLSGIVAAVLVRGWRGYLLVVLAVVLGMAAIFVLSAIDGTILPFDAITATLWTLWLLAPVTLGYVIGRVGAWLIQGARGGAEAGPADAAQPPAAGVPPTA